MKMLDTTVTPLMNKQGPLNMIVVAVLIFMRLERGGLLILEHMTPH